MPTWESSQYLKFAAERTQPAIDLAARIAHTAPARIIDLGCGPGNSTAVVAARWPGAELTGLDNSPAMIAAARKDFPLRHWLVGDISTWASAPAGEAAPDVIFSNAALQWVPDHARLLPRLFVRLAPGGALAFQVPANFDAPAHTLMRTLAASPAWRAAFAAASPVREWQVEPLAFYYDILAPLAARIDLWTTDYIHVLPSHAAIVEWYRGTGLRPWLEALANDNERERFLVDYETALATAYPLQPDGRVLFPFRRLFAIAYRAV